MTPPPADKDKDKGKDKGKAKPAPRRPPARLNIRDAASKAAERRAAEKKQTNEAAGDFADARTSRAGNETNGHGRWPDYRAEADTRDPWEGDEPAAPGEGVNRTLGQWLEAVVPPEAQLHFLAAAQEFAAGVQTTLDYHLHPDDQGDDEGTGALRIDIE